MNIKNGVRALTVAALLVAAGTISAGVATADDNPAPPMTRFINTATDECLTAHGSGAFVDMEPCNGGNAQLWAFGNSVQGWYIQDEADVNCLRVVPGTSSVDTESCDFGANAWSKGDWSQIWENLASGSPSTIVSAVSGGPCLSGVGSSLVVADYSCGGDTGWYH